MNVSPEVAACAAALRARFGDATAAILFYGSGMRAADADTVLDFYVLVDDLRSVIPNHTSRLVARLLPPNVYAISIADGVGARTCKVAVITTAAFARAMMAFAPHLWARFAQPVSLVYVRDTATRGRVIAALARAVETAIARTQPLMRTTFAAEALWRRVFAETYAAELRPESQAARARELVASAADRYRNVTAAVLGAPESDMTYPTPAAGANREALLWALRRPWGKLLNALRLMKAAFTFAGGLDYAVTKIARHSGVRIPVTEADRRRPLLGGIRIFLEARRKGGVR